MMTEKNWQYQIRLNLTPESAELARREPGQAALKPLMDILDNHQTMIKCQYDAFADYVAAAEREGVDQHPLYRWTKATIEDPDKKAKYLRSFVLHARGEEVYDKPIADALVADLQPLVGGDIVEFLRLIDTNPANSPQPPKQYQ